MDSQSLSPAIPVITQWTYKQSSHGVTENGIIHWLDNMDCYSQSPNWLQLLLNARSDNSGHQHWIPTLSPRGGTIPQDDQLVTCWEVDHTGLLPPWKGQCFVLTGAHTFLYLVILPKLPPMNFQNALSTVLVFHTVLFLTKELTL